MPYNSKILPINENPDIAFTNPMLIGCSGGGGHNAAIIGVNSNPVLTTKTYQPKPYIESAVTNDHVGKTIHTGIYWSHLFILGWLIRQLNYYSPYPVLPSPKLVEEEIQNLRDRNNNKRPYIDMMLDACPAGYESAALWNIYQRQDNINMLRRCVSLQGYSDRANYDAVKTYFLNKLNESGADEPFTSLISTQAIGLPALCDAVLEYNQTHDPILIHQYLTDLPTDGAVHYFDTLNSLTPEQCSVMKLYGVGLSQDICNKFLENHGAFNDCIDIPPNKNPMIRSGFKNQHTSLHDKWHLPTSVTFKDYVMKKDGYGSITTQFNGEKSIPISANERVASIMLGSQASSTTLDYVKILLNQKYDKIFVFGGMKPDISAGIDEIIKQLPRHERNLAKKRIIPLGNQDDVQMQPIMTRSNVLYIRGGGLSVMEQMAMQHHPNQAIFIHHQDQKSADLTSGISWEDGNADQLIDFMSQKGIYCSKTSPSRALLDLLVSRLSIQAKHCDFPLNLNEKEWLYRMFTILSVMEENHPLPDETIQSILSNANTCKILSKLAALKYQYGISTNQLMSRMINEPQLTNLLLRNSDMSRPLIALMVSHHLSEPLQFDNRKKTALFIENIVANKQLISQLTNYPLEWTNYQDTLFVNLLNSYHNDVKACNDVIATIPSYAPRNEVRLAFLRFQCINLQHRVSSHGEIDVETYKRETLQGIQQLIECTDFPLGWWGLFGSNITITDGSTKRIPYHLALVYGIINRAEQGDIDLDVAFARVHKIIDNRSNAIWARQEYQIFKPLLEEVPNLDKSLPSVSVEV